MSSVNKIADEMHEIYLQMKDELFKKKPAIINKELLYQFEKCIGYFDDRTIKAYRNLLLKYHDDYETLTNNELLVLNVSALESSFTYKLEFIEIDKLTFNELLHLQKCISDMLSSDYGYTNAYQDTQSTLADLINTDDFNLTKAIFSIRIIELLYAFGSYAEKSNEHLPFVTVTKFSKPLNELTNRINKCHLV